MVAFSIYRKENELQPDVFLISSRLKKGSRVSALEGFRLLKKGFAKGHQPR